MLEAESTPGPQCDRKYFMSMKNLLTPTGIEPATYRFVAQHRNHCDTASPSGGAMNFGIIYFAGGSTTGTSWSCSQAVWHIPLLCVQWKTADDGQRNCPKHVEFYSKNKFEKLVHLVGFIVRMCRYTEGWICKPMTVYNLLGTFTKLRNRLLASSCPLDGFSWNLAFT